MSGEPSQIVEYPYLEIAEIECELGESLSDSVAAESFITSIAREFNLELFQTTTHEFEPQGLTSIGIVGESHISLHTWPEYNYCHVEIFSCRELPCVERIEAELEESVETVLEVMKRSR